MARENLPNVIMQFDCSGDNPSKLLYRDVARHALKNILPPALLINTSEDPEIREDRQHEFASLLPLFHSTLPLFHSTPFENIPANISFFVLSKVRPNAFQFFFEMISHWLIPGKRLNVVLFHAVDFALPDLGSDNYTLCEVMIHIDNLSDLEELRKNLPIIETEVRLGMQSSYYARRILEIKGLTADAKTSIIQAYIASLIARLPKAFDYDILTEMQHVLVMCRDDFKAERSSRHLARIICGQYLFRKTLRDLAQRIPDKRHLFLKLFQANLHKIENDKKVLGLLVGFNYLRDKEVFEERHLLSAIQNYVPSAHAVEHSFFANRRGTEPICTFYMEIEKPGGEKFTPDEIRMLRQELPADLKDRIEHLMHPIFMPRNEEEIMRNILSLSNQIKFIHDLPQVVISFDQQTHTDLFFTVILVRVMKPGCAYIQEMFNAANTQLGYIHDRSKTVGFLRKKYAKEAAVFGVSISKNQFLRRDHSIDLNKARQTVAAELVNVLGDIRDFNGGLISKQNELMCAFREEIGSEVKYNELLLENFFYSLTPDVMRTVLDPMTLKTWFMLLLESIEAGFFAGENYAIKMKVDETHVYAMIKTEDSSLRETLNQHLNQFDSTAAKMGCSFVSVYEISYIGYLFISDESNEQQHFCQTLQNALADWNQKIQLHTVKR